MDTHLTGFEEATAEGQSRGLLEQDFNMKSMNVLPQTLRFRWSLKVGDCMNQSC